MNKENLQNLKGMLEDQYRLIYIGDANLKNEMAAIQNCIRMQSTAPLLQTVDWITQDAEYWGMQEALTELKRKCIRNGWDKKKTEELIEDNQDIIEEEIRMRDKSNPLEELIRNTGDINIRIEMISDYDCINSFWLENQGGYRYQDSYLKHIADTLKINPKILKKKLTERGIKTSGRFPDKKSREGKELASYDEIAEELENSTCGANLLTFLGKISLKELYDLNFRISKITIPKGNRCGLYSSWEGGGSLMEIQTEKDTELKLEYNGKIGFKIIADDRKAEEGYSLKDTYGVYDTFFGKELKLTA